MRFFKEHEQGIINGENMKTKIHPKVRRYNHTCNCGSVIHTRFDAAEYPRGKFVPAATPSLRKAKVYRQRRTCEKFRIALAKKK